MKIYFYLVCFLLLFQVAFSQEITKTTLLIGQKKYPLYPKLLNEKPEIPSPFSTKEGIEIIIGITKDKKYALVLVTLENEGPMDYSVHPQKGKGLQCYVDSIDFPTFARTGLHSDIELEQTRAITGRSIAEITDSGRPESSSGAGFMAEDEDIISVIKGDNRLVKKMGLTHPQVVKPLFHLWNMVLLCVENDIWNNPHLRIDTIVYNDQIISITYGGKGYQYSIFNDKLQGAFHLEMSRELTKNEVTFLEKKYSNLSKEELNKLKKNLSYLHAGEMAFYYAQWYGFYEGHTEYRADPISVVSIFGLKSIEKINEAFDGKMDKAFSTHFTKNYYGVQHP